MVGLNPLGILLIPALAIFLAVLAPIPYLPWRGFLAYGVMAVAAALMLWYASSYEAIWLGLCFSIAGVALLVGWVVQIFTGQNVRPLRPNPFLAFALLIAAPVALVASIEYVKFIWHKSSIPSNYSEAHATYIPRKLFTKCEISIWHLASITSPSQTASAGWSATPYPAKPEAAHPQDSWLNGVSCSATDERIKAKIIDALNGPGSMYLAGKNGGLILIPSLGYIVHAFNE